MRPYVVVDIETTGTQPLKNDIIEIGALYVENDQVKKSFKTLICPTEEISDYITSITGITNEMVKDAPKIEEVMPRFIEFCGDAFLIGHNIIVFDYRMLKVKANNLQLPFERDGLDTLIIARKVLAHLPSRRLGELCQYYNIQLKDAHRAYADAYATYELYKCLKRDFLNQEPELFTVKPFNWEIPKASTITEKQKKFLLSLMKQHHIEIEEDLDQLTKSEASRRIDQIINQYGRL